MSSFTSTSETGVRASAGRTLYWRLAGAGFALIVALLLAECVLRLLPVSDSLLAADPYPARSARRVAGQTYTWSLGWDMRHAITGKINSDGFVSPEAFDRNTPGLALLGDSFAEGLMLDYGRSLAGRIQQRTGSAMPVYNLGISGAGLPHYLGLADELREHFRFRRAVIVVNEGDFVEGFSAKPGLYHWNRNGGADLVRLAPPRSGWGHAVAASSALFRYLRYHLKLSLPQLRSDSPECGRQTLSADDEQLIARYLEALPQTLGLNPGSIMLVFAGSTGHLHTLDEKRPQPARCASRDRLALDRLRTLAGAAGFPVLDAERILNRHFRTHRRRLDLYPVDGHWNALATEVLGTHIAQGLVATGAVQVAKH